MSHISRGGADHQHCDEEVPLEPRVPRLKSRLVTALRTCVAVACLALATGCSSSDKSGQEQPAASTQKALFSAGTAWTPWLSSFDANYADVNGDGKADIIGVGPYYDVVVALSTGSSFSWAGTWQQYWDPSYTHGFADVNGDHKADMIGVSGSNVIVALSTGSSFGPAVTWATWAPTNSFPQLADVNGDGKADLVSFMYWWYANHEVTVLLSTGSSFAAGTIWQASSMYDYNEFHDVDGDGKADLLQESTGGSTDVRVGLSTGSSFAPGISSFGYGSSNFGSNWFADINGDGKADWIDVSGAPIAKVRLSIGSTFSSTTMDWHTSRYPSFGEQVDFADFDGDGAADIVERFGLSTPQSTVYVGLSTAWKGAGRACTATSQCSAGACINGGCCDVTNNTDPLASVAIDPTAPTDFVKQVSPLYSGAAPTQILGVTGAVDEKHVSVVRGKVLTAGGAAVPCAKVSVVGSPNLGATYTRADGSYLIAVNGGGPVTIRVESSGYLSADRQVDTQWLAYAFAKDVRLLDPGSPQLVATDSQGAVINQTVVSGDTETDAQGTRSAKLIFSAGTTATVVGESTPRTNFNVQVKEMTNISTTGRDGMVATLPAASAFTYAVSLSLQGAENKSVTFSQAVPVYIDNFLNFKNGEIVPVGYYDTDKAQWVASDNGRVINIVGKDNATGEALLDIDAAAGAESAAVVGTQLGITHAELVQLATTYSAGVAGFTSKSLWRFVTTHFSAWDANWGWGPSPDATAPNGPPPTTPLPSPCDTPKRGSIIACEPQVLREELPIAGTPFKLSYSSNRHPDGATHLLIPVTGSTLPTGLKGIQLEIYVAGNKFTPTIPIPAASALPYVYDFSWNGLDASGRRLYGSQKVSTRVGYTFDGAYQRTPKFGYNGNGTAITANTSRFEATLWQTWTGTLDRFDAQEKGLGGWELDVHHSYDPLTGTVHLGNGSDQAVPLTVTLLTTIAGTGATGVGANNVLGSTSAINIQGSYVNSNVAVAANGDVYFSDTANNRVRKVDSNGIITTINDVANASGNAYGDEGPISNARFQRPTAIAMGPDGSIYICDSGNNRVRRIDGNGIIHAFAGSPVGNLGNTTDTAAASALFYTPTGVAVAPDGTVFIADSSNYAVKRVRDGWVTTVATTNSYVSSVAAGKDGSVYIAEYGNGWITRVSVSGQLTRVAGGGSATAASPYGDGGPATAATLSQPDGVAIGPDGLLYIADKAHSSIRRVRTDGIIETVAGNGLTGSSPDGLPATNTLLSQPRGLGVGPDGTLYIADTMNQRIRKTTTTVTSQWSGGSVPSTDGQELYYFDAAGRHLKTVDRRTSIIKYNFRYDTNNHLIGINDRLSLSDARRRETVIQRANGVATGITAPRGPTTSLSIVGGDLIGLVDPENGSYTFEYYGTGGLLHYLWDPQSPSSGALPYTFAYSGGRLTNDSDAMGKSQSLGISSIPNAGAVAGAINGWRTTYTSQTMKVTTFDTKFPETGVFQRTTTTPDQLQSTTTTRLDGKPVYSTPGSSTPQYSSYRLNPNGSSFYSASDADPTFGMQAPIASRSAEVMGPDGPTRVTTRSRTVTSGAYSESTSVNGGPPLTQQYTGSYPKTFTTTTPGGRTSTRVIDSWGRTTQLKVGNLTESTFTYEDNSGSLTSLLKTVHQNDGVLDRSRTYTYFPAGSGNSSGYLSSVSYDQTGLASRVTSYTRDGFGRALSEQTGADLTGFGWTDGRDNLTSVTPPGDTGHTQLFTPLNQLQTYTPPSLGSNPVATSFTYTDDRKPSTTSRPDGTGISWTYDPTSGKLSQVKLATAPTTIAKNYSYYLATDTTTGAAPGELSQITGPYSVNTGFTYFGSLPRSTSWSGDVTGSVAWTYDNDFAKNTETATGFSGSATTFFGYDADKLVTCASSTTCSPPDSNALQLVRDTASGLLLTVTMKNIQETYSYNNFGELKQKLAVSTAAPAGTLAQFDYDNDSWALTQRRDQFGRITHQVELLSGTSKTVDYLYSAEGRLTNVALNGSTVEHYDYSAQNGNRSAAVTPQRTVVSSQVQYDGQDRLTQYGPYAYTYTNNGELKTKTDSTVSPSVVTTYSYDTLGNLLSVTPSAGPAISYIVDGLNRRVAKKRGTTIVRQWLYHDSLKPIAELDGSGNLISSFVYASNTNSPDYMIRGGKTYRIITDQVGSPRLVVNIADASDVPFAANYTAFGEQTVTTGTADFLPFGFAGGLYDLETGLVRFGARDYDPVVGRWTSKDPILFDAGQANLYVYAANDPVNKADPSGLIVPVLVGACWASGVCEVAAGALADALLIAADAIVAGALIHHATATPKAKNCEEICNKYIGAGKKYVCEEGNTYTNDRYGNAQYAFYQCVKDCEASK
ncbi:MAG TPA: RHS repeat-associated core domain-containing protein [Polyangiaceae bacterium]|nr:RHS repeat-associated core domain-containing protein [Polyangiaceae bacterium]